MRERLHSLGWALALAPFAWAAAASDPQVSVHDPSIAREGGTYYLYSTGPGIPWYSSTDLVHWARRGRVFPGEPSWVRQAVPTFNGHIWAPDIVPRDGRFYLYYAVSGFGRNSSAIGVTVNATLDPGSPDYKWVDQGVVLRSIPGRDLWNAIDPNVVADADGGWWLAFGSFWSGVRIVRLAPDGRSLEQPEEWHAIAKRERSVLVADEDAGPAEIEAPYVFRKGGDYFLFVSWGLCCRGKNSTYRLVIGRSRDIRGPYLDRDGRDLARGGGSLFLGGNAAWPGLGHNCVVTVGGRDYIVFHAYEGADGGMQKLKIAELTWDSAGWPTVDPGALDTYRSELIPWQPPTH